MSKETPADPHLWYVGKDQEGGEFDAPSAPLATSGAQISSADALITGGTLPSHANPQEAVPARHQMADQIADQTALQQAAANIAAMEPDADQDGSAARLHHDQGAPSHAAGKPAQAPVYEGAHDPAAVPADNSAPAPNPGYDEAVDTASAQPQPSDDATRVSASQHGTPAAAPGQHPHLGDTTIPRTSGAAGGHQPVAPTAEPVTGEIPQPASIAPARPDDPVKLEDTIFEGATVLPAAPKRGAAHAWSFLLTLVLFPIAWYLVTDAAVRLLPPSLTQLQPHTLNWAAVIELVAGAIVTFVLILVARASALGAFFWGVVVTVCGAALVVVPDMVAHYGNPVAHSLRGVNPFFANVAHHLFATGPTGLLFVAGLSLLALGFVSHGARRLGRRDYLAEEQATKIRK